MNTPLNSLMFERSFNYMSRDLANVQRDWDKVTAYSRRLGIVPQEFQPNMTNEFITWTRESEGDDAAGLAKQREIKRAQAEVAAKGGVLQLAQANL
jgi:pyrimidine precursor biosynthesis enzyme